MEIKGYGVAEHKNVYSTSTLLGNWSEDLWGKYLKENQQPKYMNTISEHQDKYIDPSLMDDKQTRNAYPDPIKRANLTTNALFGHGIREAYDPKVPVQYVTMTDATLQGRMRTDEILSMKANSYIDIDKPLFLLSRNKEKAIIGRGEPPRFSTVGETALATSNSLRTYDPAPTRLDNSTFLFRKPSEQTAYIKPIRRTHQFTSTFPKLSLKR